MQHLASSGGGAARMDAGRRNCMKHSVFPGSRSGTVKNSGLKIDGAPAADRGGARKKIQRSCILTGFRTTLAQPLSVCGRSARRSRSLAAAAGASRRSERFPDAECSLFCGESGSTLRFLLPIVGILGANAVFHMEGRLPERPLEPLRTILCEHGMKIEKTGDLLVCSGKLSGETFEIPGNVSSQYVTGLLAALPRMPADTVLRVTGNVESAAYIAMTEQVLRMAGIRFEKVGWEYSVSGGQMYDLPEHVEVEGDWSNAAFFLCMGALSPAGVRVEGLHRDSAQGDRAVLDILREMGAKRSRRRKKLSRCGAGAAQRDDRRAAHPRSHPGAERTRGIGRGRDGHRARGAAAAEGIRPANLYGGDAVRARRAGYGAAGGACIQGVSQLAGGTVEACNDHRIAMAAAVAAGGCRGNVIVRGSECVNKSYPDFWRDLDGLKGAEA